MCEAYRRQYAADFIGAMPTDLQGSGDNYDLAKSHEIPALIRRTHEAKLAMTQTVTAWGTGAPRREFLHVDDTANALVHPFNAHSDATHVNIGCGEDVTFLDLARLVAAVVGYEGDITKAPSKPDGTPRKLMDVSRLFATGWRPCFDLPARLAHAYAAFLRDVATGVARLQA